MYVYPQVCYIGMYICMYKSRLIHSLRLCYVGTEAPTNESSGTQHGDKSCLQHPYTAGALLVFSRLAGGKLLLLLSSSLADDSSSLSES